MYGNITRSRSSGCLCVCLSLLLLLLSPQFIALNQVRQIGNEKCQINKSCSYRTYADHYSKEMTNRVRKWIYR